MTARLFGAVYPSWYAVHDGDALRAAEGVGFSDVVLVVGESDVDFNAAALREVCAEGRRLGLRVWACPNAVGGLFEGDAYRSVERSQLQAWSWWLWEVAPHVDGVLCPPSTHAASGPVLPALLEMVAAAGCSVGVTCAWPREGLSGLRSLAAMRQVDVLAVDLRSASGRVADAREVARVVEGLRGVARDGLLPLVWAQASGLPAALSDAPEAWEREVPLGVAFGVWPLAANRSVLWSELQERAVESVFRAVANRRGRV